MSYVEIELNWVQKGSTRSRALNGAGKPDLDCSPDQGPAASSVGPGGGVPDGGRHACRNKHDPKGCDERCIERVVSGSQVVRRLTPASETEAVARAALLDRARGFIMFVC